MTRVSESRERTSPFPSSKRTEPFDVLAEISPANDAGSSTLTEALEVTARNGPPPSGTRISIEPLDDSRSARPLTPRTSIAPFEVRALASPAASSITIFPFEARASTGPATRIARTAPFDVRRSADVPTSSTRTAPLDVSAFTADASGTRTVRLAPSLLSRFPPGQSTQTFSSPLERSARSTTCPSLASSFARISALTSTCGPPPLITSIEPLPDSTLTGDPAACAISSVAFRLTVLPPQESSRMFAVSDPLTITHPGRAKHSAAKAAGTRRLGMSIGMSMGMGSFPQVGGPDAAAAPEVEFGIHSRRFRGSISQDARASAAPTLRRSPIAPPETDPMPTSRFTAALVLCLFGSAAFAAGDAKPVNTVCPVMLEEIDPSDARIVEFNGEQLALCCARCASKWKSMTDDQRTAALAKAMSPDAAKQEDRHGNDAAAAPVGPFNETCPITGKPAKAGAGAPSRVIDGVTVAFADADAAAKWDALDRVDRLSALTRVADFGPVNDMCPIGNEKIDPALLTPETMMRYKGRTLAFCCPSCPAGFRKWSEDKKDAFVAQYLGRKPVNTVCPVAQHEINAAGGTFPFLGSTVELCCPDCVPAWLKWDNEKRAAELAKAMQAEGR